MNETIYIKFLGKFSISHNGCELTETKLKMKQLITLLTYILHNREKNLYVDNIYDILWPNENSDNPAHALRNLIYRLRLILKKTLSPDTGYIISLENSSYGWNHELATVCDTDQFEQYIKIGNDVSKSTDERIEAYIKAEGLYDADFSTGISGQDWVIPIAGYYRHMYCNASKALAELLLNESRLDEALKVCLKYTYLDPYDEKVHQNIIIIYNKLGENELAEKHYHYIKRLFKKELDVDLSRETKNLYHEISVAQNSTVVDLHAIKKIMLENENFDIPLFCDFGTLTHLYNLQIRSLARTPNSQYLLSICLRTKSGNVPPKMLLQAEMNRLTGVLKKCLRKNDVVATYSPSQYILMLATLSHENTELVRERIEKQLTKCIQKLEASYSVISIEEQ